MTIEPQVTHPPVTHPEPTAPASPATAERTAEKPATTQTRRKPLRMPPPKILSAIALVVVALELLVWQVGGPFWGGVIHGVLLLLAGLGLLVWSRWRGRRDARLARTAAGQASRFGSLGQRAGHRTARGPLSRLLGRNGRAGMGSTAGGRAAGSGRRGLLSRLTGGRAGAGRSGSGTTRSGGLLGRLGRTGSSGRRTGSGPAGRSAGRTGGLLGRLGRRSGATGAARSGRTGTAGRRGGLRSALGRAGAGGRSLLSRANTGRSSRPKSTSVKPTRRSTQLRRGAIAAFLRGVREGAQGKPEPKKKPSPGPQPTPPAATQNKPAPKPDKPQPPSRAELVKEAVEKVADATPASVTSRRSRGTAVGSMRDILAAAEDLAAQMKAYDEEDMHVFVRELPQLGEALSAIEGGIKMMASRAESEWPLAAPVVEALGSVAGDVKAAASTVGEAKQAVHRENETDIERGEAPRQGERRWNV